MTRYIKQRDHFSCGPVVILNAFKWLGENVTYGRHYHKCRAVVGCHPRYGTPGKPFCRVLKEMAATRICRPTLAKIDRALRAGHAVIVRSRWEKLNTGHVYLVTRRTGKSVFCVNMFDGHVWRRKTLFKSHYLKRAPGGPAAWIIWNPSCPSSPKHSKRGSKYTNPRSLKSLQRRRQKARSCRSM